VIADRELAGVKVRVHYPEHDVGPAPVVVFSHGLGGSRMGYAYIGRALATHGYVSIHPSHDDGVALRLDEVESPSPGVAAVRAIQQAIDDPRNWEKRPRGVSKILDELPRLEELVPRLRHRLDSRRVAIAGHSYGAYTALLCAGARIELEGDVRDFSEPRARAFIALSPPGNGSRGLGEQSWARIDRPVLCITGTLDAGLQGQPPSWREESFHAMRPPDKMLVVLDGATHFTFSGGRPRRPADPAHLQVVEAAVIAFLDRHLKGADTPFPALRSARVERK
jgi:predicted dienelactone hydrolase